MIQLNQDVKQL